MQAAPRVYRALWASHGSLSTWVLHRAHASSNVGCLACFFAAEAVSANASSRATDSAMATPGRLDLSVVISRFGIHINDLKERGFLRCQSTNFAGWIF